MNWPASGKSKKTSNIQKGKGIRNTELEDIFKELSKDIVKYNESEFENLDEIDSF